jgi:hypothetical protein
VDAVIVLLLLGVIWALVLVPPWLQNRREARPTESIRSFHRQLWLLERTSPGRGATRARRLSDSDIVPSRNGVTVYGGYGDVYGDSPDYAQYGDRAEDGYGYPAYGDVDEDWSYGDDADDPDLVGARRASWSGEGSWVGGTGVGVAGGHAAEGHWAGHAAPGEGAWSPGVEGPGAGAASARWAEFDEARRSAAERSPAELRRRAQGYRRRRRVLATLLLVAVVTAPPAAFLGGTAWWAAQIVADVLLVSYVALLVQRQRRAIEREEKVHYLAPIRAPRPAVVVLHGGAAR